MGNTKRKETLTQIYTNLYKILNRYTPDSFYNMVMQRLPVVHNNIPHTMTISIIRQCM